MLRMSKYTLAKKDGEKYLLFNTLSKAFIGITFKDPIMKSMIDKLIDMNDISEGEKSSDFDMLIKQGLLTNLSFQDEDKLVENYFYSNYFSNDVGTITLAPSLSCNLNCVYCYQSGYRKDDSNISTGTNWEYNAFEFIKKIIESREMKKIAFVWFGGEPLLYHNLLGNLSNKIKAYSAEKSIKIKFEIITNATLINQEILSEFINLPMDFAQITLDGSEKYHNITRPYIDGSGTYQDICLNIERILKETNTIIALRFNLSQYDMNLMCYSEFVSEMKKRFGIYIKNRKLKLEYPVLASEAFSYKNSISKRQYSYEFIKYLRILADAGIDKNKTFKYMPPFCTARTNNSFVIGPEGNIYKCWEHIGNSDYIIGNIETGMDKLKEDEWKVIGSHYYHKKCVDCKFLPICLGGCPLKWGKYRMEPECPFFFDSKIFWDILKFTNGIVEQ